MLVAPTEPAPLRALGRVSSTPELYGADFMLIGYGGLIAGVQRKEVSDLLASIDDDRLGKESSQLQQLAIGVLLIEGQLHWTDDDELVSRYNSRWTRSQLNGVLWSWQSRGLWVVTADTMGDTIRWLSSFGRWLAKDRHTSLLSRKNPQSPWGKANNRDWAIHFLQGIPGIGVTHAAAIYDHFGGIPMSMDVGREELEKVKGIGKKRAAIITTMFSGIERLPRGEE